MSGSKCERGEAPAIAYMIIYMCIVTQYTGLSKCNSFTTAVRDFADIYTRSTRAAGPRANGVCIGKTQHSRGISGIYHSRHTCERSTEYSPCSFYTSVSDD